MFNRIYSRSSFPSNEYKHNSTDFKSTLQPYAHNKIFIEVDIFPEIIFPMKQILSWRREGEEFKGFSLLSNTLRTIAQLTRKVHENDEN